MLAVSFFLSTVLYAQINGQNGVLPKGLAPGEEAKYDFYNDNRGANGITSPPSFPVRTMAEWEEVQTLTITWTGYIGILTEIVRHAVDEVEVIIICDNPNSVNNTLTNAGISTTNVSYLQEPYNSIWMRDYAANTVYENEVDSLYMVDWIYNRPRPDDDVSPVPITNLKGITLYETTQAPNDLVNTGGNFMVDGWGTAFASKLILEENEPGNPYNVTAKTEAEIDQIMADYMGITRYIKMETLPYDAIHHIDMHMKLLDEETLLIGEYPQSVADGPQIEANIQYVLSNYQSVWGDPYEIVRVEMPPENGVYPDEIPWWNAGAYRTYTNCVFLNKTVLVPTYEQQYDTTALRILREELPGYKVIGIECNDIIQASGALHCITHTIGVNDPLWISHQRLDDTFDDQNPYQVDAIMKHRSGISSANLYWTIDTTAGYNNVAMTAGSNDTWTGFIPAQPIGTVIYYYVEGNATNGKTQVRPIVAPDGWWRFKVLDINTVGTNELLAPEEMLSVFPNPAGAITCVPVNANQSLNGSLKLYSMLGSEVQTLHQGQFPAGESKYFFNAADLLPGAYLLVLDHQEGRLVQEVLVK